MDASDVRMIVKEDVSRRVVMYKVHANGFHIVDEIAKNEQEWIPYEVIWETDDEETSIHYIEDHVYGVRYLFIQGEEVERVVSEVRGFIDVYTQEELIERFDRAKSKDDRIKELSYLAVGAPGGFDARFFDRIKRSLSHDDVDIRMHTIEVMSYIDWNEIRKLIQEISTSDPDETIRTAAASLARSYDNDR